MKATLAISDELVLLVVCFYSEPAKLRGDEWHDLSRHIGCQKENVEDALRYMHLRGDALPYRVICHPNYPFLRRFERRR